MTKKFQSYKKSFEEMYEKMWVSVADDLPDCDEMCYVKVQDGKCTYVDEIFYEPTMKVWVDKENYEYYMSANITHWMYRITP